MTLMRKGYSISCAMSTIKAVSGGQCPYSCLMYEHAYFLDYATKRKDYIETFMKNINWKAVNEALARCGAKQ